MKLLQGRTSKFSNYLSFVAPLLFSSSPLWDMSVRKCYNVSSREREVRNEIGLQGSKCWFVVNDWTYHWRRVNFIYFFHQSILLVSLHGCVCVILFLLYVIFMQIIEQSKVFKMTCALWQGWENKYSLCKGIIKWCLSSLDYAGAPALTIQYIIVCILRQTAYSKMLCSSCIFTTNDFQRLLLT